MTTHEYIESLWNGFLMRNPVLLIWKSYAGLMVLSAQHVALFQSHGIKLEGGWFAPDAVTKHQSLEVRSSTKHAPPLRLGLKLLGI